MNYSLRLAMPVALICFSSAIIYWVIYTNNHRTKAAEKTIATDQVKYTSTSLQANIEHAWKIQDHDWIQASIAELGTIPNLKSIFFIDAENKILASTNLSSVGKQIKPYAEEFNKLDKFEKRKLKVKKRLSGAVFSSDDDQYISSLYPVHLQQSSSEMIGTKIGYIFLQFDLAGMSVDRLQHIKWMTFQSVIMIFLYTFLLGLTLHFAVTKNIETIITAMNNSGTGKAFTKLIPKGPNEIAKISAAFNNMQHDIEMTTKALKVSNKKFESFTNVSPVGIFHTDVSGRCLFVNKIWKVITGANQREARNSGWMCNVHPDDFHRVRLSWSLACQGSGAFAAEFRFVSPTGNIRWVFGQSVAFCNQENAVIGYIGTITDITKMKLFNEKIKKAKDTAESANKAKSIFLANMSHELRTPLSSIIGYADIVRDQSYKLSKAERQEYIEMIYRNGQHLLGLLGNVLDLAQIEAGKLKYAPQTFQFKDSFSGISDIKSIVDKNQIFELCFDVPDDTKIYADPQICRQVLLNLVCNASKYTPADGRIGIIVSKNNDNIQVDVWDAGIGIKQEDHKQIFEMFEQSEKSYSRSYGGVGLGLALAKQMVELHGGQIWLKSEVDKGSTFSFSIPVKISLSNSNLKVVGKGMPPLNRKKLNPILLVEDSQDLRILASSVIQAGGFHVVSTEFGMEAIKLAKLHSPSLILLDMGLPDIDGLQVLNHLQTNYATRQIPVIAFTSFALAGDREKFLCAGCVGYIPKPFDVKTICEQIDEFISVNKNYRKPKRPDLRRKVPIFSVASKDGTSLA